MDGINFHNIGGSPLVSPGFPHLAEGLQLLRRPGAAAAARQAKEEPPGAAAEGEAQRAWTGWRMSSLW